MTYSPKEVEAKIKDTMRIYKTQKINFFHQEFVTIAKRQTTD